MAIERPKEARERAIASIERWFEHERGERVGNIATSALPGFLLGEIGPSICNQAVADVQERLAQREAEIDVETHADALGDGSRFEGRGRVRR